MRRVNLAHPFLDLPVPSVSAPAPHCPLCKEIPLKNQSPAHSLGAPSPNFEWHDEQLRTGRISHSHDSVAQGHVYLSRLLSKVRAASPAPQFAAVSGDIFVLSHQPKIHLRIILSFVPADFAAPTLSQETLYLSEEDAALEPLLYLPNMQICHMDQQSFHPFEQGSMQPRRKEGKDAPYRDKTHLLAQEGLTLILYQLRAAKDGRESLWQFPYMRLSDIHSCY